MDLSKSPGYPGNRKHPSKLSYLNSDDAEFYDRYQSSLFTDEPILPFAQMSVKVEMLPIEKVLANGARTFTPMDTNHTILLHRCIKDQSDRLCASSSEHPFCFGMSPFYGGWSQLYYDMNELPHAYSFDVRRMDGTCKKEVSDVIYEQRYEFLDSEYKNPKCEKMFKTLASQIHVCPIVQPDGHVYMKFNGNASGSAGTLLDNSDNAFMYFVRGYLEATPREWHEYEIFTAHTRLKIVGDDILVTISDALHQIWNPAEWFQQNKDRLGYEITSEHPDSVQLKDLTFCSLGFVWSKYLGRSAWLPKHDCKKMLASLLYKNRKHSDVLTAQRLGGVRIMAWSCQFSHPKGQSCWDYCEDLRKWLHKRYPHLQSHLATYPSDWDLAKLYFGGAVSEGPTAVGLPDFPAPTLADFVGA